MNCKTKRHHQRRIEDLLRAGNYKRGMKSFKQLIEEEKSFLEEAKTNCAFGGFFSRRRDVDGGFNLLAEDTFGLLWVQMYCKQCEEPKQGGCVKAYVNVYYELHPVERSAKFKFVFGLSLVKEDLAFHFTDFDEEHREELSWGESFDEEDWSFCGNVAECVEELVELKTVELPL